MSKKTLQEMSERDLLIRIDERTAHLPALAKTVGRHDRELLIAKVLFVVLFVAAGFKFPAIAEALGRVVDVVKP